MNRRGTGVLGNAFENALASKVNKSIGNYAVKYPADTEVDIGANDMSHHVQDTANNCPDTRIVLGGYSLGAAVTDVVLAAPIGAFGFDSPLPPGMDQHIAAVALFGNGSAWAGPITNSARSTTIGPSSCATAPIQSVTRPTRTRGRKTGLSTWPAPTSTRAWPIRPPTTSRASSN